MKISWLIKETAPKAVKALSLHHEVVQTEDIPSDLNVTIVTITIWIRVSLWIFFFFFLQL